MEFEWDEDKRQHVIAKHGVDFLDAMLIFEQYVLTWPDKRRDYGEERFISLGMVRSDCFVVVHTRRGDRRRIISAWLGGRREQREYQTSLARRNSENEG
jgi:uncharacterized DUF497 family protein